ncbi:FAD-binding protein, partial [Variovorax sp. CT11-76]
MGRRLGRDRLTHARGTRLVLGNALVARLYFSLRQAGVPVRFGMRLRQLDISAGRVTGSVFEHEGSTRRIASRLGVVLATGGASETGCQKKSPRWRSSRAPAR